MIAPEGNSCAIGCLAAYGDQAPVGNQKVFGMRSFPGHGMTPLIAAVKEALSRTTVIPTFMRWIGLTASAHGLGKNQAFDAETVTVAFMEAVDHPVPKPHLANNKWHRR